MITNPIPTPNVRLLIGGDFAVISDWDETVQLSKSAFVTKTGTHFESRRCTLATSLKAETLKAEMLKAETLVRSQAVVARVVAGELPESFIDDSDRRLPVLQQDWPAVHRQWQNWAAGLTDAAADIDCNKPENLGFGTNHPQ